MRKNIVVVTMVCFLFLLSLFVSAATNDASTAASTSVTATYKGTFNNLHDAEEAIKNLADNDFQYWHDKLDEKEREKEHNSHKEFESTGPDNIGEVELDTTGTKFVVTGSATRDLRLA